MLEISVSCGKCDRYKQRRMAQLGQKAHGFKDLDFLMVLGFAAVVFGLIGGRETSQFERSSNWPEPRYSVLPNEWPLLVWNVTRFGGNLCRQDSGLRPACLASVFRVLRFGSMLYSWRGGFCVYFQVHGAGKRSLLRILHSPKGGASMLDLLIIRGIFILVLTISAYALHPFHSSQWMAAAIGRAHV